MEKGKPTEERMDAQEESDHIDLEGNEPVHISKDDMEILSETLKFQEDAYFVFEPKFEGKFPLSTILFISGS